MAARKMRAGDMVDDEFLEENESLLRSQNAGVLITKERHGVKIKLMSGTGLPLEIWDGANLSLLRDILEQHAGRRIRVDMADIQYLPPGTFGALIDASDSGTDIRLLSPTEQVRNFVWFRKFTKEGKGGFRLLSGDLLEHAEDQQEELQAAG